MMIRERSGAKGDTTVQLIRVSWDKDRKRSVQRVLGTLPAYATRLPDDLAGPESPLTAEEHAQALAWIEQRQAASNRILLPGLSARTIEAMDALSAALGNPDAAPAVLGRLDPAALFGAVARLEEALRQHGVRRARSRKAPDGSQDAAETQDDYGIGESENHAQKAVQGLPRSNRKAKSRTAKPQEAK